jgi:hypothetical protein
MQEISPAHPEKQTPTPNKKGGIVAALLRSPLAGAKIVIDRPVILGRKVDL